LFSTLFILIGQAGSITKSIVNINALSVILLTASVTLSIWISGKFFDRRSFQNFGLQINKEWWSEFGFGLLLGSGLMLSIFLLEILLGWINIESSFSVINTDLPFGFAIIIPLIFYIAVGFYEELLSRGYQLTNLAEGLKCKRFSPSSAILASALISSFFFSLLHLYNPHSSKFSTINLFIAGLLLASGYIISGKLAVPIGLHISWNFFQGNVFGFPVSGNESFSATFIMIQQTGPDFWTGGKFGPEGGLIGTIVQLLGIGLILVYYWYYKKLPLLNTELAEEPPSIL